MGCEDNITRTTIYISKSNKARVDKERSTNKHFSLSSFVDEQLTNYFYGDEFELQSQMMQISKRLDEIDKEQKSLLSRKTDLQQRIVSFEKSQKREKQLYERFISNINNRIRNSKDLNVPPDYSQIVNHFHRSFFPDNNINRGTVKQIFYMVENKKMDFETFQSIRRGDFAGN